MQAYKFCLEVWNVQIEVLRCKSSIDLYWTILVGGEKYSQLEAFMKFAIHYIA